MPSPCSSAPSRTSACRAAIRTDNGVPFASAHALYGLSKLAVWWLRLGIQLERITPGHPEQNGRHERMHRTLKAQGPRRRRRRRRPRSRRASTPSAATTTTSGRMRRST